MVKPADEHQARQGYFADNFGPSWWGPTAAEHAQQRRELDEDARALEADLWLMRHGSMEALGRVVDFISAR